MLKPLKRHQKPCKRKEYDQGYTRCVCPVWIRGTLKGKRGTVAVSKYLQEPDCRNMERGRDLALLWEKAGELVRPEAYASTGPAESETDEVARFGTVVSSQRRNGRRSIPQSRQRPATLESDPRQEAPSLREEIASILR